MEKTHQKKKEKVLSLILSSRLNSDEALPLALYYGLSELEIREITHVANILANGGFNTQNIPEEYRDLIERLYQ